MSGENSRFMIVETIALALMLALYFLSLGFLKISLFAEAIVGVIFGTVWEAITAGTWYYKGPLMSIYGVPVGVVLGCGASC